MNGAAERLIATLFRKAATMLNDSRLPPSMEAELMLTANYLRNRSPAVGRHKTPYELMAGQPP